jgi:Zn-dependent metalloprotease
MTPRRLAFAAISSVVVMGCSQAVMPDSPEGSDDPLDSDAVRVAQERLNAMRGELGLTTDHSFAARDVLRDELGQTHVRFRQLFRGVPVWGGEVISHATADGRALAPTPALKQGIAADLAPMFTVNEAVNIAKTSLGAVPGFAHDPAADAELVIYPKVVQRVLSSRQGISPQALNATDVINEVEGYRLAFHLHLEIESPGDTRHTEFLVDARTGDILEQWDNLQTAAAVGTGNSQYSGVRQINTNSVAGGFELRDLTRPASGANVVYDLGHLTTGQGTIYRDVDNTWGDGQNYKESPEPTTSANGQTAAVDAAFGLQAAWDMYKNVFGRNGIDGAGTATYIRVHYDNAFDNAFYSDTCRCITYGDGTKLQTLTSLDVAAHELSHGVTSATARLIYSQESGGLNESNSDIFGALTEFYAKGANGQGAIIPDTGGNWTQGEQLITPAFPLKMR